MQKTRCELPWSWLSSYRAIQSCQDKRTANVSLICICTCVGSHVHGLSSSIHYLTHSLWLSGFADLWVHAGRLVWASQLPMLAPLFSGPDVEASPWQRSISAHYRMGSDPFFGLQHELTNVVLVDLQSLWHLWKHVTASASSEVKNPGTDKCSWSFHFLLNVLLCWGQEGIFHSAESFRACGSSAFGLSGKRALRGPGRRKGDVALGRIAGAVTCTRARYTWQDVGHILWWRDWVFLPCHYTL